MDGALAGRSGEFSGILRAQGEQFERRGPEPVGRDWDSQLRILKSQEGKGDLNV